MGAILRIRQKDGTWVEIPALQGSDYVLTEEDKKDIAAMVAVNGGGGGSATADYITPAQFGAAGDGKTDDADALQACINHAIANHKRIWLDGGRYIFSKPLRIESCKGFVMYGDGIEPERTCLDYTGTGTAITTGKMDNMYLSNFCLRGGGCDTLLHIGDTTLSTIRGVIFGWAKTLLHLVDYAYLTIEKCGFAASQPYSEYCIYTADGYAEFLWVNECSFDGGYGVTTTSQAINLQRGHYISFTRCDFTNFVNAIDCKPGDFFRDTKFNNCYFTNNIGDFTIDTTVNGKNFHAIDVRNCYFYKHFAANAGEYLFKGNIKPGTLGVLNVSGMSLAKSVDSNAGVVKVIDSNGTGLALNIEMSHCTTPADQLEWNYPYDCYYDIKVPHRLIPKVFAATCVGDGTTRRFSFVVTKKSPGRYFPLAYTHADVGLFVDGKTNRYQYWTKNTMNGEAKFEIEFEYAIPAGNNITMYVDLAFRH